MLGEGRRRVATVHERGSRMSQRSKPDSGHLMQWGSFLALSEAKAESIAALNPAQMDSKWLTQPPFVLAQFFQMMNRTRSVTRAVNGSFPIHPSYITSLSDQYRSTSTCCILATAGALFSIEVDRLPSPSDASLSRSKGPGGCPNSIQP